ncbi:EAL domain-containing protein [Actimicrobium sp. CCC2.4]|uniref:EAL domain-containing protein n=1 Tax=Actimicrobium sp. CCC2.4 TaxID=3048606 RepID=UPI002AC9611D|nr:EAL domain-containing protein [Actimicrobium sp. CCC2.4]MEB0136902.1 EAL domain-containing protein [Actimicrobium sp. CCC2.4]WPX33452.1 EAL domain-containing protein [Actimicrobium sp. CCC2.4]
MTSSTKQLIDTTTGAPRALSDFVMDISTCGIIIMAGVSDNCRILYVNAAFLAMTGYTEADLAGRHSWFLQIDERDQPERTVLLAAMHAARPVTVELRNYRMNGVLRWNELCITPYFDDTGSACRFVGMMTDITSRKLAAQLLSTQSSQDVLTGLANGIGLQQYLDAALINPLYRDTGLAIVTIAIDQLAVLSDSLDEEAIDTLARVVAERLQSCITTGEIVARTRSDSYTLVLHTGKRLDTAARCQALQRALGQPIPLATQAIYLTCSIGLAMFPEDQCDSAYLLKYAGMALTQARQTGRNNQVFYSASMSQQLHDRTVMESALSNAVRNRELSVLYQPQVNLTSGEVSGAEALVRWHHPALGDVPSKQFVALAEETGLINDIGLWVLERVCLDLATCHVTGMPKVPVAINVSPVQLRDPQLADQITAFLATSSLEPALLTLEITEAAVLEDDELTRTTLARLHRMGIGLALDDFGTGFSSLSYLRRFPFKTVKIDRSFIHDLTGNPDDAAIIKAIISMAHTLGIAVVADGVETEAQCHFLRDNMCDDIQGHLFSPAVSADGFNALMISGLSMPEHLRAPPKKLRTLLLVDDEVNMVSSLKRLLRRDDYHILTANSGAEGLAILAAHPVDVILSDQRMPGMTGVEFLSIAKTRFPRTVRLVLSGYTELQSVTDAVNEGAIYKFLTKPWDDAKLRGHIQEAFHRKELADDNRRLTREVYAVNLGLAAANRQQQELLGLRQEQITRDASSLHIVREAMRHIPIAVLAIDDSDMIAFINDAAARMLPQRGMLLGGDARYLLPEIVRHLTPPGQQPPRPHPVELDGQFLLLGTHLMGQGSSSSGWLVTLTPDPQRMPAS